MSSKTNYETVLKKKAKGYTAEEVVEEYARAKDEDELTLVKRKVSRKHVPPDLAALKYLREGAAPEKNELAELTDEELRAERERLLGELREEKVDGIEKE